MRTDSVHGTFKGVVDVNLENNSIIVNGQVIKFINGDNPEDIDYTQYGIEEMLIDNTGAFTDKESLSRHINSKGVSKVLLTAPGKGIPNIVYGINSKDLDIDNLNIFSVKNHVQQIALISILHVVESNFGIEKGHLETVHSYTNDQNLLDNMLKNPEEEDLQVINMVITSTGAEKQ